MVRGFLELLSCFTAVGHFPLKRHNLEKKKKLRKREETFSENGKQILKITQIIVSFYPSDMMQAPWNLGTADTHHIISGSLLFFFLINVFWNPGSMQGLLNASLWRSKHKCPQENPRATSSSDPGAFWVKCGDYGRRDKYSDCFLKDRGSQLDRKRKRLRVFKAEERDALRSSRRAWLMKLVHESSYRDSSC